MTTILDIAKLANVSKSTVSRVLNNQAGVSKKSQEKVLQAIRDTNFIPNKAARSLKNVDSNTILILFHRPSLATQRNPFYLEFITEISRILEDTGYDVVIQMFKNSQSEVSDTRKNILNLMVRGVIILSSPMDESFLFDIDQLDIPIIMIGKIENTFNNIYSIDTDNFSDSYRLVDTLIQNGHKNIACIHPPLDVHVSTDRVNGYLSCMASHDFTIDPSLILEVGYASENRNEAIAKLLSQHHKFTAIFSTDILLTLDIYKTARDMDLAIPEQFSVISFNSDTLLPFFSPEPSGMTIPIEALSMEAVDTLIHLIEHKHSSNREKRVIVSTHLSLTPSIKILNQ